MKTIAILGSTGSVGKQALEVVAENPNLFRVCLLTSNTNIELLVIQAKAFLPKLVIIADESKFQALKQALSSFPIEVQAGEAALASSVLMSEIDLVLTALMGYCGLLPTINAIKCGKTIALANKETMVVAGELINSLAQKHHVAILPVDSEHSAIYQCLQGEKHETIEKLILTASGGPFKGKSSDFLKNVTPEQALVHPNWKMGAKITIDSASLMNKGLEIIEARWLFAINPSQIEVIVHPQSVIYSMVQFTDGSIKAQLGVADMRLPIQYAMGFPNRIKNSHKRYNFIKEGNFSFEEPDPKTFRNLALAIEALNKGGNMPCILNAANEIVVDGFLKKRIGFLAMSEVIDKCMNTVSFVSNPVYDDYVESDAETRRLALSLI